MLKTYLTNPLVSALLAMYTIIMGAARLAKFKSQKSKATSSGFIGLPIIISYAWTLSFVYLNTTHHLVLLFSDTFMKTVYILGVIVFPLLQLTNIKFPKMNNPIFLGIVFASMIASIFSIQFINMIIAYSGILFVVLFTLYGLKNFRPNISFYLTKSHN